MPEPTSIQHILIGTAGHIDHGKTRLVATLTDIDTDRLPEEKARGISIDLGFAHWEATVPGTADGEPPRQFRFGIVDVPGHERFVKNMVAGATGVNLALLVVAADDSVMPQTREHLEIMDLLGVRSGVVAITKTDLVDADFIELVEADIRELVEGTFLEDCKIVPVSSESGAGIETLKDAILSAASEVAAPERIGLFRLPIDRSFSVEGHGCVVTGSVISGRVQAGDRLTLLPDEREVRVRAVQNHGLSTEMSGRWQRTAVNLAGVKNGEIRRGQELVTPGSLRATTRMIVAVRSLGSSSVLLKNRMPVTLHLGTAEVAARLVFKTSPIKPGGRGFAELRLNDPVVAAYGQRFILRRTSPAITIAGGHVLDPSVPPGKRLRHLEDRAKRLNVADERQRLASFLSERDAADIPPTELFWRVGIPPDRGEMRLQQLRQDGVLITIGSPDRSVIIHRDRLESLGQSVLRAIRAEVERRQPRRSLPRNTLKTACRQIAASPLLDSIFEYLQSTKQLVAIGSNLGPADMQITLSKNQRALRDRLLQAIADGGLTPPTVKELAESESQPTDQIETLLNLCGEDGLLVRVPGGLYFTPESIEHARRIADSLLSETETATLSQLREAWGISRKFAVPLGEYFDGCGITTRTGDFRRAGARIRESLLSPPLD